MEYSNNLVENDNKTYEGFFYIIQTPDVEMNVYKIGKTTQIDPNKRLCRYPKYSTTKYTIFCINADLFEDIVMRKFKMLFKRRMEYGIEYYEGDIYRMIDEVHHLWLKYNRTDVVHLSKETEKIKPNGWQYFANEWLSKHIDFDVESAYAAYVDIMTNTFASIEYADKDIFITYFNALML